MKPGAHRALPEVEQYRQHHRGLERREHQLRPQVGRMLRQRRDQDQQRHHRQILEQQHADHLPAVQRVELELFRQHLADDRGRRHRDHAAQHDACAPIRAGCQRRRDDDGERQRDLGCAEAEYDAAHRGEPRQAELEPDAEHQEHHAEFGQPARAPGVRNQAETAGPDRNSHQQIAEQRRQLEQAEHNHHQHRGKQQYQHQLQRVFHFNSVYSSSQRRTRRMGCGRQGRYPSRRMHDG